MDFKVALTKAGLLLVGFMVAKQIALLAKKQGVNIIG